MKIFRLISLALLSLLFFINSNAQPKGKYIPTKYDSVEKKIPQQVYGNKVKADLNKPIITEPKTEVEKIVEDKKEDSNKSEPSQTTIDDKLKKEKQVKNKTVQPQSTKKEIKKKKETIIEKLPEEKKQETKPVQYEAKSNSNIKWTLQNCIQYAMDNNLQVASSELNERLARLVLQQNRNSRLPSLNGDASLGESYGRSIDPTSNQFVTSGFAYNNLGLSSQTLLFGWFQRKHQIEQSQLDAQAANSAYNQLKDDIALNVATGFLRVLLSREQVKINEGQLKLDNEQYIQTVKFANAGQLPELNVAQMLSQLSTDTANLVSAKADERIALLQLRALMNFNFEQEFDIVAPEMNISELSSLYSLPTPEGIYSIALKNQHQMKFNELKLMSAKKTLDIAKAVQYPQLSLIGSLGTNYSSTIKDIIGQTYAGETPIGTVKLGNSEYPITRPNYSFQTRTRSLFNQYGDNIRANIGLGLTVPIFNGFSANTNIQKAKIGLVSQQIVMDSDKQKLKQDIYKAYEEAKASSQKYNAAKRAQDAAERALDFAVKRFAIGMINTFEYTSILNSFFNASSSVLSSKYDLIFKLKVLDYYMGNQLKL
ncbi:MAG TPA: TolC family protein [Chitinophagaceae bacterium]|nr:TolC family protein [Chitinophagaceae bacterium]